MPKYLVEYGFDCPAYGEVEINIDSEDPDEIIKHIQALYRDDELIVSGWEYCPDVGCDNHRIVQIFKEHGKPSLASDFHNWGRLDFGFFDLTDESSDSPCLWIVYDDDANNICGHSTQYENAKAIADALGDVRILKVKL